MVCSYRMHSCGGGCVLHLLGAIPRSATHDHLRPQSPVDRRIARDSEPSLLRLRYNYSSLPIYSATL